MLVAFGLFLVGLTVVVFARPAVAERFFMSFASSARAHYTEQVGRLLIGMSLIIRSATMWQPKVFWFVGWAIVLPSLALILTPWKYGHTEPLILGGSTTSCVTKRAEADHKRAVRAM